MICAAQRYGSAAAAELARLRFDYHAASENVLLAERRSRCLLEPVLSGSLLAQELTIVCDIGGSSRLLYRKRKYLGMRSIYPR
jgi:hypothetical protein